MCAPIYPFFLSLSFSACLLTVVHSARCLQQPWVMWTSTFCVCSPGTRRRTRERANSQRNTTESPERRAFQPPVFAPGRQVHPAAVLSATSHPTPVLDIVNDQVSWMGELTAAFSPHPPYPIPTPPPSCFTVYWSVGPLPYNHAT